MTMMAMQAMAKAELQLNQDALDLANYTLFSRARQPSGPMDFSKLEGQLPPMTGPPTPQQAMQTLGALEPRIKIEYEVRRQKAMSRRRGPARPAAGGRLPQRAEPAGGPTAAAAAPCRLSLCVQPRHNAHRV